MNPRTTGLLLLAALGLGAFVYLYELEGEGARLEAEQREKRLFPGFEAADVAWIALRTSDGVDARFEREGEGWRLVSPLSHPADDAVARMAEALAGLTHEAEFDAPGPDAEYGLDEASARVVRFGVGDAEHVLRLGRETPVGSDVYAKPDGGDAVYTVASYRQSAFARSLTDLREKDILDFDPSGIRAVEASWPGGRVSVERAAEAGEEAVPEEGAPAGEADGSWRMRAPVAAEGDGAAIERLLSELSFLRADGFLDAPGEDTQRLLDPPDFAVTLRRADAGAEPLVLAIGRPNADDQRPVRAGPGPLFLIDAERIEDFPRETIDYRDRGIARFEPDDVHQLDFFFRSGWGDPSVIRADRDDEEGWTSTPEPFADGKLPRIADELSRLEAVAVLAESMGEAELEGVGLSPPNTIVTALGAPPAEPEGKADDLPAEAPILAEVHFGAVTGEGVVARRAGADTVYRVAIEAAENLPVSLEAFRNRFRAPDDAEAELPDGAEAGAELLDASEESP